MKKVLFFLIFVLCLGLVGAVEYQEYSVSIDSSLDFVDLDPGMFEVNRALHFESSLDDAFVLEPYESSSTHVAGESSQVVTSEIWLYTPIDAGLLVDGTELSPQKWGAVFYKDSNEEVELFGHVDLLSKGNYVFSLNHGEMYDVETIPGPGFNILGFDLNEEVQMFWGLMYDNGMYDSLGYLFATEEVNEIIFNYVEEVGATSEDVVTDSGIVLKNPGLYGANDQVVFSVPDQMVMKSAPVEEVGLFDMYRAASEEVQSWTWLWVLLFCVACIVFGYALGLVVRKVNGKKVKRKVKKRKKKKVKRRKK